MVLHQITRRSSGLILRTTNEMDSSSEIKPSEAVNIPRKKGDVLVGKNRLKQQSLAALTFQQRSALQSETCSSHFESPLAPTWVRAFSLSPPSVRRPRPHTCLSKLQTVGTFCARRGGREGWSSVFHRWTFFSFDFCMGMFFISM